MKKQIIDALKLKYKNLGLSDKTLESVAEMLMPGVTEEANIETAVAGVENLLKTFQSDADKRVTDAVAKAKAPAPEKAAPASESASSANESKEESDITKAIQAALAPLLGEIATLKAGDVVKSRKQILETKLEKVNPALKAKILKDFSRMKFETDEDFNAYLTETEADLGELSKAETEMNLGALGKPLASSGNIKAEASKEEVAAIVNDIM